MAKKTKTITTKPREAASPASLDRWQRIVQDAIDDLEEGSRWSALAGLKALLRSMRKAERR